MEGKGGLWQSWCMEHSGVIASIDRALLDQTASSVMQLDFQVSFPFNGSALSMGLEVAALLADSGHEAKVLASAMALPTLLYLKDKSLSLETYFDPSLVPFLTAIVEMESMHSLLDHANNNDLGNFKKLVLSMADDVRVIEVKLMYQLILMRRARELPEQDRLNHARWVQTIYAPLANRLGMGDVKWQLEDLSFRYLDEKNYRCISKALQMKRVERESYVSDIVQVLSLMLEEAGIARPKVTGRAKHIYSIFKKLERKKTTIEDIYDTTATRIIVDEIAQCYTVLSLIHGRWSMIPGEFDDYIAKPKPNGYQSIHTAIIGPESRCVEIQIRTQQMHDAAEKGVASHWSYKEGKSDQSQYQEKIDALRQLIDWQSDIAIQNKAQPQMRELFGDEVYVFTPTGEIVNLPIGSTPLDFAYQIHTDIGHRCKGVEVNGRLVPLNYHLKTGDRVSVSTSKEPKPSRDWLNPTLGYLKTHRAQTKVAHWFRRHQYNEHIVSGVAIAEKLQRKHDIQKKEWLNISDHFHYKNFSDLHAALSMGELGQATIVNRLRHMRGEVDEREGPDYAIKPSQAIKKSSQSQVSVAGVDSLLSHFAKCCNPVPGDPIMAYVATVKGIVVHHSECTNLLRAKKRSPDRVFDVAWETMGQQLFVADIVLTAYDRQCLLPDISHVVASQKIRLTAIDAKSDHARQYVTVHLSVEVHSVRELDDMISALRQLPEVTEVGRA